MAKTRGRPRTYDRDKVIDAGLRLFLERGYGKVTIDQICETCGLSKPSFYAGFKSKAEFFELIAEQYRSMSKQRFEQARLLSPDATRGLSAVLKVAIEQYFAWHKAAAGCLVLSVTPAEAINQAQARKTLSQTIADIDAMFWEIVSADEALPARLKPGLAASASSLMQSISLRARAGYSIADAQSMADEFIKVVGALRRK